MIENTRTPTAHNEQGWTWVGARIVRFFAVTPDGKGRLTFEWVDSDGKLLYDSVHVRYLTPPKPTLEEVICNAWYGSAPYNGNALETAKTIRIASAIRAAWPDVDFGTPT